MTADERHYIDKMVETLIAAKHGRAIEQRAKSFPQGGWQPCPFPNWDFYRVQFRVKPEPREFIVELCPDGSLNLYRGRRDSHISGKSLNK